MTARTLTQPPRPRRTTALDLPARICRGCDSPYWCRVGERQHEFGRRQYCSKPCASRNASRPHVARESGAAKPVPVPVSDPNWRQKGACTEADDPLFYPTAAEDTRAGKVKIAEAKRICLYCPAIADCRMWGIANETWGVWGGLSEAERARLRKRA